MIFMKNKILTNNFKAAMIAALMLLMPGLLPQAENQKQLIIIFHLQLCRYYQGKMARWTARAICLILLFPKRWRRMRVHCLKKRWPRKNGVEALKYSIQLIVAGNLVSQSGF